MENASKALIIAGAILLAISIIGIGMAVFNQAAEAGEGTGLQTEQAAAYNQKFQANMGQNVRGTTVRNLYEQVRIHNITNATDESLKITINSSADNLNSEKSKILSGKTYKVEALDEDYDQTTGYIKNIRVTEAGK